MQTVIVDVKEKSKDNLLYSDRSVVSQEEEDDTPDEKAHFMEEYHQDRARHSEFLKFSDGDGDADYAVSKIEKDLKDDYDDYLVRSLSRLTRYTTNDKKICARELQRNRRRNKVRKMFKKSRRRQESCMNRLRKWYSKWEFVDNESFCPNCFIGTPNNSIQEYGTVDGFIKSVEKQFEYVIKRSDRMALRRAVKDSILCQRCFYPLHMNKFHEKRKTRFQVMVEITSSYFFYVFMWIPMMLLILPFGIIGMLRNKARVWFGAIIFMED